MHHWMFSYEIMAFVVHFQLLLSKCQEKIFYYLAPLPRWVLYYDDEYSYILKTS